MTEKKSLFEKIGMVKTVEKIVEKEVPEKKIVEIQPCDCASKIQELVYEEAALQKEITRLQNEKNKLQDKMKEELRVAKDEVADVRAEAKREQENIKHAQKILDEKKQLETDRIIFNAEKKAEEKIVAMKQELIDKLENEIRAEREKMAKFMQQVMDALPNVNARLRVDG